MTVEAPAQPGNLITHILDRDLAQGTYAGKIVTRFPPEPNGTLHIGHAKALWINFELSQRAPGAVCHLRFDDTNPGASDYAANMQVIEDEIRWLGYQWHGSVRYTSDYFEQLAAMAVRLIERGLAFVCDLSAEEMTAYRGTLTEPGRASPYRERSVAENLELFQQMRAGAFANGARSLRAKIDMASGNIVMRDPVLYRIRHASHPRTGERWCIYPSYDFAHPLSDELEEITHSFCTLEFADNRAIYDWLLETLGTRAERPYQYETARLELSHTVLSTRHLRTLVDGGVVDGWDDPRLPTLSGLRRRGVPPAALKSFCRRVGVSKNRAVIDLELLEEEIRDELNRSAPRAMCVADPLRVVLTNYDGPGEELVLAKHPSREDLGTRSLHFGRELWIERSDFHLDPPPGYHRLRRGGEVRLRGSYVIRCDDVVLDAQGDVCELRCSVDLATLGRKPEGRKVKGVIHWVGADAVPVTLRLYDRLFGVASPVAEAKQRGVPLAQLVRPESLVVCQHALAEPQVGDAQPGAWFQFERLGYFVCDLRSTDGARPRVLNRVVGLRDTWSATAAS